MKLLWLITLIWAFSFSLIGVYLAGQVDTWFSALSRTALATLMFLPLVRFTNMNWNYQLKLTAIGAVQIGCMYSFYYHSFLYLTVPEVLLFTVLTPLYITLINDLLNKQFNRSFFLSALIAIIGAITIRMTAINDNYWIGLLLVQGANICFAIGQISYKRLTSNYTSKHSEQFFFFFLGATLVLLTGFVLFGDINNLPTTKLQWGIIVYLGIVASGIGYFGWNYGATKVNVGELAVMNNALIPLGIVVNIIIWNREADLISLITGSIIIGAALFYNNFSNKKN